LELKKLILGKEETSFKIFIIPNKNTKVEERSTTSR